MKSRLRSRNTSYLIISMSLVIFLSLVFLVAVKRVRADSGGFPTPTPSITPTLIIPPTATVTSTAIVLPTQDTSSLDTLAEEKSLVDENLADPVEGNASSKSLAQVEPNQLPEDGQNNSSSGLGSLFIIGLMIGVVILGLGVLVVWMLRRSHVIP